MFDIQFKVTGKNYLEKALCKKQQYFKLDKFNINY